MRKFIFFLSMLLVFSLGFSAQAQEGQSKTTQAPVIKLPKWKVAAGTSFFNFSGHRPADGNIYGFQGVEFESQNLDATYMIDPFLHVTLSGQYVRKYAETEFLGQLFKDQTEGFGDTRLKVTKTFLDGFNVFVLEGAYSIPTGSITERNPNIGTPTNYPYNMQLGSGTNDFIANLVYVRSMGRHQVGGLGSAILRFGRNKWGYRMGNEYIAKTWYTYNYHSLLKPGIWLNYYHLQRMHGQDSTFGRNIFVEFYHTPRHFWDLTPNFSSEYAINNSIKLKGLVAAPLWQESKNIDNIQLYTRWFAQLGIEGTF
ncbi:MAG: hypothetical protein AAF203_05195 [Pseudomonadota bacterium]